MKKILKSELTPQLVKHQETTLHLFNVQRDIFSRHFLLMSVPESQTLASLHFHPSFLQIMKTEFVEHQKAVDMMLYKP